MKKAYRIILTLISAAAALLCAFPLMSAYSGGTESCDLIVRGFNLMEFSAWGSVCLFAPLLIPGILLGGQSRAAQEVEIICLLLVNIVCYSHSFNAARAWLAENSTTLITYHPNMLWYPSAFIAVLIFGWIFVRFSIREAALCDDDEEAIEDE